MNIMIAKTGYYSGLFNLFFKETFSIRKYWSGKIINIGLDSIYIVFDFRKNWIKDMYENIKRGEKDV